MLNNKETVEDLVQETLAVVVKLMPTEDLRLEDLRLEYGRHSYLRLPKTCLRNVLLIIFAKNSPPPLGAPTISTSYIT